MKRILLLSFVLIYTISGSPDTPDDKTAYLKSLEPGKSAMILIPSGKYETGENRSADNPPETKRDFKAFRIDIHPVTNSQYLKFIERSGYRVMGEFDPEKAAERPDYPVTGVTRGDAGAYAAFFGKRLPTEWEWEIAARALKENFSSDLGRIYKERKGIFFQMERKDIAPVFSTPPNGIGFYDHIGNIFEWTSGDYPLKYILGKNRDRLELGVVRGGSWTNIRNDVTYATRTPFPVDRSLPWLGFRCAEDSGD